MRKLAFPPPALFFLFLTLPWPRKRAVDDPHVCVGRGSGVRCGKNFRAPGGAECGRFGSWFQPSVGLLHANLQTFATPRNRFVYFEAKPTPLWGQGRSESAAVNDWEFAFGPLDGWLGWKFVLTRYGIDVGCITFYLYKSVIYVSYVIYTILCRVCTVHPLASLSKIFVCQPFPPLPPQLNVLDQSDCSAYNACLRTVSRRKKQTVPKIGFSAVFLGDKMDLTFTVTVFMVWVFLDKCWLKNWKLILWIRVFFSKYYFLCWS